VLSQVNWASAATARPTIFPSRATLPVRAALPTVMEPVLCCLLNPFITTNFSRQRGLGNHSSEWGAEDTRPPPCHSIRPASSSSMRTDRTRWAGDFAKRASSSTETGTGLNFLLGFFDARDAEGGFAARDQFRQGRERGPGAPLAAEQDLERPGADVFAAKEPPANRNALCRPGWRASLQKAARRPSACSNPRFRARREPRNIGAMLGP
jgi:hypothetical protein